MHKKQKGNKMNWLKRNISKRLISMFGTPILLFVLAKVNAAIGGILTEQQITSIIEWVLATLAVYVGGQTVVEGVKTNAIAKVAANDAANPNTPAPDYAFMDKI